MSAIPLGCATCGIPRRRHDADDHRYQVPDMTTVLSRAAALKNGSKAA